MKETKRKISIALDESVLEAVKARAEEDERSISQYINILLRNALKAQEQRAAQEDVK